MARHFQITVLVGLYAMATVLLLFAEMLFAFLPGTTWFLCAGGCFLLVIPFMLWGQLSRGAVLAVYGCFILGLALVWTVDRHLVAWDSRKQFLCALHRVQRGMTHDDVESIMGSYIRGSGWPMNPFEGAQGRFGAPGVGCDLETTKSLTGEMEIKGAVIYRHSNLGEYDSDFGVVFFSADRVTGWSFLPD